MRAALLCRLLLYSILAGSLNITNGYSGQTSLGHAAFYCVGAYTVAILTAKCGWSFWLALPLSAVGAILLAVLVSIPTVKLKGIYFSIVTLGMSEIVRIIALNWNSLTGGSLGIKNIPRPRLFGLVFDHPLKFYYLFLIVSVLFLFVSYRVIHSRIGNAWMSIRENELAARSLGIRTRIYKMGNFAYGALWAGLAGGIYAAYMQYIDSAVFSLEEGFNILSMVIIGGQGTLIGPLIGDLAVNGLTELLRSIGEWRFVMYGILIIVMMWFRPQGLAGASDSILAGKKIMKRRTVTEKKKE